MVAHAPGRPEADESLVARFQGGDASAFDDLVLRHREAVYRLAYRLVGRHAEADDLCQDAFLRAYRGLRGFRGDARFSTWLTRIVMNLALNARRGSARRAAVPLEEAADRPAAAGDGLRSALRREVRRAVGTLPPRQRQVLVLKVYEGLKFAEIAALAGMTVGTAKATFFQAVRGLRRRLVDLRGASVAGEGSGS